MRNNTKRLTYLALTVSFALILSFIESRIPAFVAIPGVKMGLALKEEIFPEMKVVLFMNIHPQIQLTELNLRNQRFLEIICGTDIMQPGNVQKQPAEKMIQML